MASRLKRTLALGALALVAAWAPGSASALDMVVGDVTIANLTSYGFTETSSELTFDGGTTDELYQMFGYLGTSTGATRIDASSFTEVSAISQVGSSAVSTLQLSGPGATTLGLAAGALLVDYAFNLLDDTSVADEDSIGWNITLTNTTASDITVTLYTYLDLDLGGAADWNDDLATIDLGRAVVTDADDPTAQFVWDVTAMGMADHFELGTYPGVRDILDGMGTAQDLSDTVSPFGPADFTAAYQFDLVVAAGSSTSLGGSTTAVPEPGSAVLTAGGLIGLTIYGRRRTLPLS